MSYLTYKVIHLLGVFTILVAMGGLIVLGATGQERKSPWRRLATMTNGIGLFLVMVAGFGLLARLQIDWPWPGWVFSKILIWLIFGFAISLALRIPKSAQYLWWGSLLLAGVAAYLANFKPF